MSGKDISHLPYILLMNNIRWSVPFSNCTVSVNLHKKNKNLMYSTIHLGIKFLEDSSSLTLQHLALLGCLINIEQPSNQALQAMAAVVIWHICRLYTVGIANQTARSEHTENSRDNNGSLTFKYKGQSICIYCTTYELKVFMDSFAFQYAFT